MKITYLFREKRPGNFSIEELFENIATEISKNDTVEKFVCPSSNRIKNYKLAQKLDADVFHITGDVNYLCFSVPKRKTIITIHDLGHFENTLKGYKKWIYKILWFYLPLNRVSKITTISEFTKRRLLNHFNIPETKIEVIPNPAPFAIFKNAPKSTLNNTLKILQIGSGHNKNVSKLIDAVENLNVELMLIRKKDASLESVLKEKKIQHHFYENLSYGEVYQKYVECDIVYFASNYEGFGMPILEAQLVGRAIITSNTASMPEVAGNGAHFVDFDSTEEIKNAILILSTNDEYRNQLINNGLENVKKYTLENICSKYLNLYKQLR